jgi:hypothetical protein
MSVNLKEIIEAYMVFDNDEHLGDTKILCKFKDNTHVIIRDGDTIEYFFGDNRGKKCIIKNITYMRNINNDTPHVDINCVCVIRYYDDEKRWSKSIYKILCHHFFKNFLGIKQNYENIEHINILGYGFC